MWLRLNFTDSLEVTPRLVNMANVDQVIPDPAGNGSHLSFGANSIQVEQSVDEIAQMLGVGVFVTQKMTDGTTTIYSDRPAGPRRF